jgi:hypothetical protein
MDLWITVFFFFCKHQATPLDCEIRLKIINDVPKGLAYFAVKPQSIVLDEMFAGYPTLDLPS